MPNHRPDGSDDGLKFTDALPHSVPCGIIILDEERKLSALNPQAVRLTGLEATNVLHQSHNILPASLRQIIDDTFASHLPQHQQITYSLESGAEFTVHVCAAPAQTRAGQRVGVIAVLNDLTAAENLEHNMRRLDRLASIGTLSASMAHEIKNALVAVRTFVDLLIHQNKDAELAGIVSHEIGRIDSIVSQILRFAGPAKPTFSSLHLHDLVEHSLRLIEHQLADKDIHLKKSLAASPDLVRGDSYQLQQVLLNLFFNAIEAMRPGGQLSIATDLVTPAPASSDATTQLRITIQDNGSGIAPENVARLFDPFFTTKKNGSGLGLSITRRIIQEHHGTINVTSELNQGTTFTILLPRASKR